MTQRDRDPVYYRKCAKEVRKLADEISDPEDKGILLKVVEEYELLAKRVGGVVGGSAESGAGARLRK